MTSRVQRQRERAAWDEYIPLHRWQTIDTDACEHTHTHSYTHQTPPLVVHTSQKEKKKKGKSLSLQVGK